MDILETIWRAAKPGTPYFPATVFLSIFDVPLGRPRRCDDLWADCAGGLIVHLISGTAIVEYLN